MQYHQLGEGLFSATALPVQPQVILTWSRSVYLNRKNMQQSHSIAINYGALCRAPAGPELPIQSLNVRRQGSLNPLSRLPSRSCRETFKFISFIVIQLRFRVGACAPAFSHFFNSLSSPDIRDSEDPLTAEFWAFCNCAHFFCLSRLGGARPLFSL